MMFNLRLGMRVNKIGEVAFLVYKNEDKILYLFCIIQPFYTTNFVLTQTRLFTYTFRFKLNQPGYVTG